MTAKQAITAIRERLAKYIPLHCMVPDYDKAKPASHRYLTVELAYNSLMTPSMFLQFTPYHCGDVEYAEALSHASSDIKTLLNHIDSQQKEIERLRGVIKVLDESLEEAGLDFNEFTEKFDIQTYYISQKNIDKLGRLVKALAADGREGKG